MSRGLGRLQTALGEMIVLHGKPMTFAEICAIILQKLEVEGGLEVEDGTKLHQLLPSFTRSMRRALHRMVSCGELIAIGDGGRAEPYRYFIHPLIIWLMGDTPEAHTLQEALRADPGASEAERRDGAKLLGKINAAMARLEAGQEDE
jgi:hypothetical protein